MKHDRPNNLPLPGAGETWRRRDGRSVSGRGYHAGAEGGPQVSPGLVSRGRHAHQRFIREAKSAAALEHPYICNIKQVNQTDEGQDFIVMEYVPGQTLRDRLSEGPLSIREVLHVGIEIAEALEVAHEAGIIHRDLKPANIMLTPQGHVKVMDFG